MFKNNASPPPWLDPPLRIPELASTLMSVLYVIMLYCDISYYSTL